MSTPKQDDQVPASDNWTRHEAQLREYERISKLRGGKSIHQLVAEANAPKIPRGGRLRHRGRGRRR